MDKQIRELKDMIHSLDDKMLRLIIVFVGEEWKERHDMNLETMKVGEKDDVF